MIISQKINHISGENYDVDISVTEIPTGHFISIGRITFSDDDFMREIEVEILPLEDASGGDKSINTGVFSRREEEGVIRVSVTKDGNILGRNNQVY